MNFSKFPLNYGFTLRCYNLIYMNPSALELIKNDHVGIEKLFSKYNDSNGSHLQKREIAAGIIEELTMHMDMEEAIAYPRFKEVFNVGDVSMVDEAYVEHKGIKVLLEDLKKLEITDSEFDATIKVIMEQVRNHVEGEEDKLLVNAEKILSEEELKSLGVEMQKYKELKAQ